MDMKKNLAQNIRAYRGQKSLTEFSEELGIGKSTLHCIEHGVVNISLATLEQIAKRLHVYPSTLLQDHAEEGSDPQIDQLVSAALYLSDKELQELRRLSTEAYAIIKNGITRRHEARGS